MKTKKFKKRIYGPIQVICLHLKVQLVMPYLKEIREKKNEFTLQCKSLTVNFSLDEKFFYILLSVLLNISSFFFNGNFS